jgi:hypothetical protein
MPLRRVEAEVGAEAFIRQRRTSVLLRRALRCRGLLAAP